MPRQQFRDLISPKNAQSDALAARQAGDVDYDSAIKRYKDLEQQDNDEQQTGLLPCEERTSILLDETTVRHAEPSSETIELDHFLNNEPPSQ